LLTSSGIPATVFGVSWLLAGRLNKNKPQTNVPEINNAVTLLLFIALEIRLLIK
jgi:hypothetical protein